MSDGREVPVPEVEPPTGLRAGPSPRHGLGVFATRRFAAGEVLERAPVLVVPTADEEHIAGTALDGYCFAWDGGMALALGFGSLYNHSTTPNARYWTMPEEGLVEYVAHTDIEPGDEVCINYNGEPTDDTPVWFELA